MDLGIMFFSSVAGDDSALAYDQVLEIARTADAEGLSSVWLPERHFHRFGGLFPNPAVLGAAVAVSTRRIGIRAGSVVTPLHDPLRIAEEWAVVDALSRGRVGVSVATGWSPVDFALGPDRFEHRREVGRQHTEELRALWRGESVRRRTGDGRTVELSVMPRPHRPELPLWVTSSGSRESVRQAAAGGANLLTHLVDQDLSSLGAAVAAYREEYRGEHPGRVSVMLHTYLDEDTDRARRTASEPLLGYLRSALQLEQLAHGVPEEDQLFDEELLDISHRRYLERASLIGDAAHCRAVLEQLADLGVDEVACLIDFGVPHEDVLASVGRLAALGRELPAA
ncbi:MupA/Atu3671 family FMN-dependent luciferase-like monooxygenase [Kitasatospora sp. NPDC004272]